MAPSYFSPDRPFKGTLCFTVKKASVPSFLYKKKGAGTDQNGAVRPRAVQQGPEPLPALAVVLLTGRRHRVS